jgi:hypothetical protein
VWCYCFSLWPLISSDKEFELKWKLSTNEKAG